MRSTWLQTFSGKQFIPLAPTVEMICVEDIAHGLGNLCRYSGQCREFYSVGQHSVMASHVITTLDGFLRLSADERRLLQLVALLHDAPEAYIVDVPTMIKQHLPVYKEIESNVMRTIAQKFNIDFALFSHPLVHEADMTMLATEKRDLMGPEPAPWIDMPKPYGGHIFPMEPKKAKQTFLDRFTELGGKA